MPRLISSGRPQQGQGIAGHGVAQIRPFDGQGHVAHEAQVTHVRVGLVGSAIQSLEAMSSLSA